MAILDAAVVSAHQRDALLVPAVAPGAGRSGDARSEGHRLRACRCPSGPPADPPAARRLSRRNGPRAQARWPSRAGFAEHRRALEGFQAEPPLFPAEPQARARVEEAERWGEEELQAVPRLIFRWGLVRHASLRAWLARRSGLPAPAIAAVVSVPAAQYYAHAIGLTMRPSGPRSPSCRARSTKRTRCSPKASSSRRPPMQRRCRS